MRGRRRTPGAGRVYRWSFYGTTFYGGANGYGTVFKISLSGALATLHSLDGTDGGQPNPLLQGADGNFYGTTEHGGANLYGTVFKVTPSGALTTLYRFCSQRGCADGELPITALVQATDRNFYGTTQLGGANVYGTVFKITPGGTLTTLYNFCSRSSCKDGSFPYSGLVQSTDGNFYGTTYEGGAQGGGTAFKITPSGTLTTLYSFCSKVGVRTAKNPMRAWFRTPTESSTGRPPEVGPANMAQFSGCLWVSARSWKRSRPSAGRSTGQDPGDQSERRDQRHV